jgi:hypothetical protein
MSIKDLSIEELQELAATDGRKNNKPPKKEYKSVLNFIKDKKIEPGEIRMPAHVIFYEYRTNYTRYSTVHKVKRVAFFHTFAQHFTQVRSNGKRYYMVNKFIELTDEYLQKAEAYKRSLTRDKQKRKSKVPSVESCTESEE